MGQKDPKLLHSLSALVCSSPPGFDPVLLYHPWNIRAADVDIEMVVCLMRIMQHPANPDHPRREPAQVRIYFPTSLQGTFRRTVFLLAIIFGSPFMPSHLALTTTLPLPFRV